MLPGCLSAQELCAQPVHVDIYRLERQDSCMVLDMSVNLSRVRIVPDCTVYLVPVLRLGSDSLELAPLMLNGPQSDRMYRRRKALGYKTESAEPHLILREGEHALPCVSYRTRFPYAHWMAEAVLSLRDVPCDCDFRMQPFHVEIARIPPVEVVRRDTVIIRDTLYLAERMKKAPVWKEAAQYEGYRADLYFPNGSFAIVPGHYLNKTAWGKFTAEVDSLLAGGGNTLLGITVTGYSSPEADWQMNDRLAKRRAMVLKAYLEQRFRNMFVEIYSGWIAESWDDLTERVSASDMPEKEMIVSIIKNTYDFDEREARLKSLAGGRPWAYMVKHLFPGLRRVSCRIDYLKKDK